MAKDIIDAVCRAEEEAQKIKAEDSEAAAELILTGKREAADIVSKARAEAENKAEEIIKNARLDAERILAEDCKDEDYLALKNLVETKASQTAKKLKELI